MRPGRALLLAVVLCVGAAGAAGVPAAAAQTRDQAGILLLAHGGKPDWNQRVADIADAVNVDQPVEVALGMATRSSIQAAVDKLVARGVTRIVAVPLFVSSHSSVVRSTEYLLGLRAEMPKDLLQFAKMDHGANHAAHQTAGQDNTLPVKSAVPIVMAAALNDHPLVAAILVDRANKISQQASAEAVVIVAHGPVPDEDNARWLADMKVLGEALRAKTAFKTIDYLTVRDDAPKPVRDAAAEELRALVRKRSAEGQRVLIVPLLLSYGGIEAGIRQRLEGIDYVMSDQGLTPDPRIVEWVRQAARAAEAK